MRLAVIAYRYAFSNVLHPLKNVQTIFCKTFERF
jgi:hypothetical protein